VILREEHRLRVFENRVLRRIFGGCRNLHNEELRNVYSSPSIITRRMINSMRMRWARNANRLLEGKPEGRRPLGKPRPRWLDNIKMDLAEIGWSGMDWIGLAQDWDWWRTLVNAVMNILVQ
jgi:hypothetical protein